MGNENASKNECYECGSEDIRYRSLLPSEPHFLVPQPDGLDSRGSNGDYSVCAPCYKTQREDKYPNEEVPEKVLIAAGGK